MKNRRAITAVLCLFMSGVGFSAEASNIIEADSFTEIDDYVTELSELYGSEGVLLVFDIDNTLLASDQPLGSSQWYDWQDSLLEAESVSPLRVASDIGELLKIQGIIFEVGSMHLTEDTIPRLMEKWQNEGHFCVALTARGEDFNDVTRRELAQASLDFSLLPPEVNPGFNGVHPPYSDQDPEGSGLTDEEVVAFDMCSPRDIRFEDGVMMVAGQHKGAMLLILMANCSRYFPAVVFVDDSRENVEAVFTALTGRGTDITAFRYGEEDETVRAFTQEQKEQAAAEC